MAVVAMNFGNDEVVMVIVYSPIGMVIMMPLSLKLGKRAKAAAPKESDLVVPVGGR